MTCKKGGRSRLGQRDSYNIPNREGKLPSPIGRSVVVPEGKRRLLTGRTIEEKTEFFKKKESDVETDFTLREGGEGKVSTSEKKRSEAIPAREGKVSRQHA